jgi:malate synthase
MEDRATFHILSQHTANGLYRGVVFGALVNETFERMVAVLAKQNAGSPLYQPIVEHFETSVAYTAAKARVFEGRAQSSGYTKPLPHKFRLEIKLKVQCF